MSAKVKKDKVVSVTYTIVDQQGETFEHTDIPVSYVHGGKSDLFEQIEQALEGKQLGDRVEVKLTAAQAFGPHNPGLTFTDDINNVPPELRRIGAQLEAQNASGEILNFVVTHIEDGKLTVDANHPLAGQEITFHVEVKDIRDATGEEIASGQVTNLYQPL
jgi:FKBP-type peptidyl-prolyl cis-trans isomerase SlyD